MHIYRLTRRELFTINVRVRSDSYLPISLFMVGQSRRRDLYPLDVAIRKYKPILDVLKCIYMIDDDLKMHKKICSNELFDRKT